jgi:hypothetical protein
VGLGVVVIIVVFGVTENIFVITPLLQRDIMRDSFVNGIIIVGKIHWAFQWSEILFVVVMVDFCSGVRNDWMRKFHWGVDNIGILLEVFGRIDQLSVMSTSCPFAVHHIFWMSCSRWNWKKRRRMKMVRVKMSLSEWAEWEKVMGNELIASCCLHWHNGWL